MFNPFKQLGDLNQMRKSAMEIQKALSGMSFTAREGDIEITMNGNQEVQSVSVAGVPNENMKRAMTNVIKQSQQAAAGKLADISKNFQQ
jgi:DNA-binding protein YbaB